MLPRIVTLLALAFMTACSGPGPEALQTTDLAARFSIARVESDFIDLPFLLSQESLWHDGWDRAALHEDGQMLWALDTGGSLALPFYSRSDKQLRILARSRSEGPVPLEVAVAINGTELGVLELTAEPHAFVFDVPVAAQRGGQDSLVLRATNVRPQRPHAFALVALAVWPSDRDPGDGPRALQGGLYLPPRSRLSYALAPATDSLRVELPASRAAASLVVSLDRARRARLEPSSEQQVAEIELTRPDYAELAIECPGEAGVSISALSLVRPAAAIDAPAPAIAPASRPNILIFLSDTLRADSLGAYGEPEPTSPRFDRFARSAHLFERAWADSSWTRPSVASLFTGLGAPAHGIGGLTTILVPEFGTLAESLRDAGYATAAFVENGVVAPQIGFDQGFDEWHRPDRGQRERDWAESHARRWLQGKKSPWFLYVHVLNPHRPLEPLAQDWDIFRPTGYAGDRDVRQLEQKQRAGRLSASEQAYYRSAYKAEVRGVDTSFGRLLDTLGPMDLLDRTIVVFTADHGEELFDHGEHGHGYSLYEEVVHIPLAIRLPAQSSGRRHDSPVHLMDLAPTLLSLAGVSVPPQAEGHDLSGQLLAGGRAEPRLLISLLDYREPDGPPLQKLSARLDRYKVVLNRDATGRDAERVELYDLDADPQERTNLAALYPLVARHLLMEALQSESDRSQARARLNAGAQRPLDPDALEALRALGYVR